MEFWQWLALIGVSACIACLLWLGGYIMGHGDTREQAVRWMRDSARWHKELGADPQVVQTLEDQAERFETRL